MKIKRYTAGRTNTGLLGEARNRMASPGLVAAGKAAPFQAIAQVAGDVANTALVIQDAENKAIDADDASRYHLDLQKRKANLDRNSKQAEAENWPADRLREANAEEIKEFASTIGLYSERNRDRYASLIGVQAEAWAEDTRLDSNIRLANQASQQLYAAINLALQNRNIEDAKNILQAGIDNGLVTEKDRYAFSNSIADLELDAEVVGILDRFEQAYSQGKHEQFYAALVADKNLRPEVKEEALKRVEAQMENYRHIEGVQRTQMRSFFERRHTDLLLQVKAGKAGANEIEQFDAEIIATGDDKLIEAGGGWRKELYLASISNAKDSLFTDQFLEGFMQSELTGRPGWIVSSEKNRKQMSLVVEQLTEGMSPEDAEAFELDTVRKKGVPTEYVYSTLKAGAEAPNAEPLANAAQMLNALRHPITARYEVKDGLERGKRARLMEVAEAARAGLDPLEVANQIVSVEQTLQDLPPETQDIIHRDFNAFLTDDSGDGFEAQFESLTEPWLSWDPEIWNPTLLKGVYQSYIYDAFVNSQGRDIKAAIEAANTDMGNDYAETWINGKKELQRNGIPGKQDSIKMRNVLFDNFIKGNTYQTTSGNVNLFVKPEEPDDVQFMEPIEIGGKMSIQVYGADGAPLIREDGKAGVYIELDDDTMDQWRGSKRAEKRRELNQELAQLEYELTSTGQGGMDATVTDMLVQSEMRGAMGEMFSARTASDRDLLAEIAFIKRQINELDDQ